MPSPASRCGRRASRAAAGIAAVLESRASRTDSCVCQPARLCVYVCVCACICLCSLFHMLLHICVNYSVCAFRSFSLACVCDCVQSLGPSWLKGSSCPRKSTFCDCSILHGSSEHRSNPVIFELRLKIFISDGSSNFYDNPGDDRRYSADGKHADVSNDTGAT